MPARLSHRLSLTDKRWIVKRNTATDNLVERLLDERWLRAKHDLCSPNVFPDMQQAVERLQQAIDTNEKIGIFGDYDCDGVTGVAILVRALRRRGIDPFIRLPHRVRDGYGLNENVVREFADAKCTLMITVDTGVSSVAEIAKAKQLGMDVVITDHHNVGEELPPAHSILHPELAPEYKEPYPSGAGVAYQFVCALEKKEWEEQQTDMALAMIGTVADLVELRGDNRTLVQQGLCALRSLKAGPLTELLKAAKVDARTASSMDIAFRIAPRINASGRMADADTALAALLDGGDSVQLISALNTKRQMETEEMFQAAQKEIESQTESPLLASASADYPHGIIGLIAGKLTEKSGKPSIIGTLDGDTVTASLRSPPAYHITAGITRHQHLLIRFGGHAQAAGCSVKKENWLRLLEALRGDILERTEPDDLRPTFIVDATITAKEISMELLRDLSRLEPYGQGNREPLFLLQKVSLDSTRCVGTDGAHLQCMVGGIKAIGFGLGNLQAQCENTPLDIVCCLGIDTWQGYMQPQIQIVDMCVSE